MAKRTQKAKATARFGARYGVSVRRNAGSALAKKTPSTHALFVTTARLPVNPLASGPAESVVTPSQAVHGNHSPVQAMQTPVFFDDPLKVQQRPIWHSSLSKLLSTLSARLQKRPLKRSDCNGGNAVLACLYDYTSGRYGHSGYARFAHLRNGKPRT